jgi:glucose-6-phosphate 1-dehydrogenase
MKKSNQAAIIVIVGISGDLSKRKLLPALNKIAAAGALPDKYKIIGITRRQDVSISDLLVKVVEPKIISDNLELFSMDLLDRNDYGRLADYLNKIENNFGSPAQRLFYLSVPPQISASIISELGLSGLSSVSDTKLLLEKPFGVDLASAQELTVEINQHFKPEQVYRIDHYLAKETAQNILVFRQNNSLFKRTWSKDFIQSIDIVAQESIGIEGRAIFYEQTGALRDLIQSHLLQLAALVLMDLPDNDDLSLVPKKRLEALKDLSLPSHEGVDVNVKRGQYRGYQEEVNNVGSLVETFVSLTLESKNSNWRGVPINLITGKALDSKFIGIKISYKKEKDYEANELILKLQPNEGVDLCLWSKKPGYDYQVDKHPLKFSFEEHYQSFPEAYEQVLYNAINSDHSLFASSEEVLESWRIIDPIQKNWQMSDNSPEIYEVGSPVATILNNNHHYGSVC